MYEATAPSNIALIKYWGKRDEKKQWPANDSLSMTLRQAVSRTAVTLADKTENTDTIKLNGKTIPRDAQLEIDGQPTTVHKLHRHLDFLRSEIGSTDFLHINSCNSFPTGCGIASSASGFAALTIAAAAAMTEADSLADLHDLGFNQMRLAHLARLGSGSAGRSLFGGYVEWSAGRTPETQRFDAVFEPSHFPLADVICILSDKEKSVSSSTAHRAAWSSPLFLPRLAGLQERHDAVRLALAQRDFDALGLHVEAEALEMHAVIMTATPAVYYLRRESSALISWLRQQRRRGAVRAYFTMDAGANVHLLCRPEDAPLVATQVQNAFPDVNTFIDSTGDGPTLKTSLTHPVSRPRLVVTNTPLNAGSHELI
jgi:diphosphomevalonate decarboxylase